VEPKSVKLLLVMVKIEGEVVSWLFLKICERKRRQKRAKFEEHQAFYSMKNLLMQYKRGISVSL